MGSRIKFFLYHLKNRTLILMLTGFLSGIIFAEFNYINLNSWVSIGSKLVFILLVFCIVGRKVYFYKVAFLFLLMFIFGSFRYTHYFNKYFKGVERFYGIRINDIGYVLEDPSQGNRDMQLKINLENFGKVIVYVKKYPTMYYGDMLLVKGILEEPADEEDFSYKEYLQLEGINYLLYSPDIEILETNHRGKGIMDRLMNLRRKATQNIKSSLHGPQASLFQGLVLGGKLVLPENFEQSLKVTGTSHIVSVSGFNVTLVIGFLMKLNKFVSKKLVFILTFFVLFAFIVVVGLNNIPALRAVLMGYVFLLSLFVGRKASVVNSLSIIIFFLLLDNPLIYKSVSFQLSIAATFGIVTFNKDIGRILQKLKVPKSIRSDFATTVTAIIWTFPITLSNFETFSILAFLVNIIVLPVVPLITVLGIIVLFLSFISKGIMRFLLIPLNLGLSYVIHSINFFAKFDFLYFEDIELPGSVAIILYLLYFLVLIELSYKHIKTKLSS